MKIDELLTRVRTALEDLKAVEIVQFDVREKTSVTDYLFIVTGTSSRHVKSIAANVAAEARHAGAQPLGIEGEAEGEWVLVDLGDIIVHVMLAEVRAFYDLESLWRLDVVRRERQDTARKH
jgi:ribosome-associated protein